jgi:alpha-1,6-mannosyltransferase
MNSDPKLSIIAMAAVLLLGLTGVGGWALWTWHHEVLVWIMLIETPVYAAAAWYLWKHERAASVAWRRHALILVVGVAALARISLILAPPVSTDIYRYIWDGRVQAAGINPYVYRPGDAQVAYLHDEPIYSNINRAETAVTIYPPFAQVIFLAVTRVSEQVSVMKAAMVGFEALATITLMAMLRRRGLPQTRIVFYLWHPLPLFEFAGSGHIDAAAIALMLLACLLADRRQLFLAGLVLGAGALVKFFPAVAAPALYRRGDWRLPVALLVAVMALYLPYLSAGRAMLGFLPSYVQEEGLSSGNGFFLLGALGSIARVPSWGSAAYVIVGLSVLAGAALVIIWRRNAASVPMKSVLLLLVLFTVLVSPHFAWYFTWLVPLLCFTPSWALIYLTGASPLLYGKIWSPDSLLLDAALYLPFILILSVEGTRLLRGANLGVFNDRPLDPKHAG